MKKVWKKVTTVQKYKISQWNYGTKCVLKNRNKSQTERDTEIICYIIVELVEFQPQVISNYIVREDLTFAAWKGGKSVNSRKFPVIDVRL